MSDLLYSYINDIAERLREPEIYGSASVMIGAGFSKNAIYLGDDDGTTPDWTQLAEKMFDELYPNVEEDFRKQEKRNNQRIIECSGKNALELAEKYEIAFDRVKLNNLIERNISDEMYKPGKLHSDILGLNWNDVFTTNYDTLLERTMTMIEKGYKVIYSQDDLPGSLRPRIVKLHGSIAHSGKYIITEEDYRTYPIKFAPFVNTVQQSMLESRLCLIGFSGNDPNFLNWVGWLRDNMGENCPQIYLCGMFNDMSSVERKMFENKKISIIDISSLSKEESNNRYYTALDKFIGLLSAKSKKNDDSIINKKIYNDINYSTNLEEKPNYYKEMITYTNELIEEIKGYVCLPSTKQKSIAKYIKQHFQKVLYEKNNHKLKIQLIGNFTYILKQINEPLYDSEANKLLEIIKDYKIADKQNTKSCIYIVLYLLLMYRIEANKDMYEECIEKLNSMDYSTDFNLKNEINIEKTKYAMSMYEYDKALEYVQKIENNSDYIILIKKACLLSQLNKKDKALLILKECYGGLLQKRYSLNKKASIIGYINLCARSILKYGDNLDAFKDDEYYSNDYNSRKIVIDSKEDIIKLPFENNKKENTKEHDFNPNSYIIHYSLGLTDKSNNIDVSFKYLLLQDLLCLPIYSNNKNISLAAINSIESTSKSPLWRWYRILLMNDSDIINSYFTRERIYKTDVSYVEECFDNIFKLWKSTKCKNDFRKVERLMSDLTIIDILSRLSIVLDETRISNIIHELNRFNECNDFFDMRIVVKAIQRLEYSFNFNVLKLCISDIFDKVNYKFYLASYFDNLLDDGIEIPNLNQYIDSIIEELEDKNIKIRDNAIAKVILLKKMNKLSEYTEVISEKIWSQKNNNGLPKSNLYSPIIWIDILESNKIDIKQSYKKYLLNPKFTRRVIGSGITINGNSYDEIYTYISCFKRIGNNISKMFNKNEILEIVTYMYDYIINEKSLINNDFFEQSNQAKECFIEINILISFIYFSCKKNNYWNKKLEAKIVKFINLFDELEIDFNYIKLIKNIDTNKNPFKKFEELLLEEDEDSIRIAFLYLYKLIDIFKIEGKVCKSNIYIEEFIQKINYIEKKFAKNIIINMGLILKQEIFLNDEKQEKVVSIFSSCYKRFLKNKDELVLDGVYNISNLMKTYYDWLILNQRTISKQFQDFICEFKSNKLNEIRMTWINVQ